MLQDFFNAIAPLIARMVQEAGMLPPAAFLLRGDDVAILPFVPFRSDADKDTAVEAVRTVVRLSRARCVLFVGEAWVVNVAGEVEDIGSIQPSEDPRRQEIVFVIGESPSERCDWAAPIIRDEQGVRLGEFAAFPGGGEGRFGGFFPPRQTDIN